MSAPQPKTDAPADVNPDELDHRARVLATRTPAIGRSIADAFVLKDRDLFLLTERGGNIPRHDPHGFGLYHHDCRFLDSYVLEIDGQAPVLLGSTSAAGFRGIVELTNPDLPRARGGKLEKHEIALCWDRTLDAEHLSLHDTLRIKSFSAEPVEVEISLAFRARFEDVYTVRGMCKGPRGEHHPARWEDGRLYLRYDGKDGIRRTTQVAFGRRPHDTRGRRARFVLRLDPGAEQEIGVVVVVGESSAKDEAPPPSPPDPRRPADRRPRLDARDAGMTRVHTDSVPLTRALDRSLRDLAVLRSTLEDATYVAAGVPWYAALFGRDALVVALEALGYDPDLARDTLRLLARYQAQKDDPSRDEEPGKIMHELRVGELARVGAIPQTPYYGAVDTTPLFLILLARHAAWTGTLDLFQELRPNVDAALGWVDGHGDPRVGGHLAYCSRASGGLANQGWKDSGDGIVMENGALARQPIALVEVQGYVHMAKLGIAALADRAGEPALAARLRREAAQLAERFARDFWLDDKGFFALALTADGPAAVLSSNPGQALWTGIVDPERARRTMESLLSEPMWSGWGIRTLSARERRYNPVAYHRGTVWPHDNALIAAGFRRHGFDEAARRVFCGILDASTYFAMHRLPELFTGFPREVYGVPIRYPVACHPQAWAAGSVPFMLESLLGLVPEAFEARLRIVRPTLPPGIHHVDLRGVRVGRARVDLGFEARGEGRVEARVLRNDGGIDVRVEEEEASREAA